MIEKGDAIVFMGHTEFINSGKKAHYQLGKVLQVGKYDLIITTGEGVFQEKFKVPRNNIVKVDTKYLSYNKNNIHQPRLGDLVLSLPNNNYDKRDSIIGVLIEIQKVPGKITRAKLRKGNDEFNVSYESLLTLEEKDDTRSKR